MKRLATWIIVFVLVVGGGIAVFWDVKFFRLFDANNQPLVMTEAESYCAASVGMGNNFRANDPGIPACMERLTDVKDNTVHDVAQAPKWMCEGVIASGFRGGLTACVDILEYNELWMITTGGITREWNDAHPRPTALSAGNLQEADRAPRQNRSEGVVPSVGQTQEDE